MLRDLYGDARSFCESDLGLPFFRLRIDSSGWDGALLTSCRVDSPAPGFSDYSANYDDWTVRLSLSETLLDQYGHNSPLAESTLRALMLATARSLSIIYDGNTAEGLEQLLWEIVKFTNEKRMAEVWNIVSSNQHQCAAFLAVSLYQLILKIQTLEQNGVQSFSYDFIRTQVFPHITTRERDRIEGRPEGPEDWEKRVRPMQIFESEDALGISLSSNEENQLISQLRQSQDQDEAIEGEGLAWRRSIRLRLHSLMSDLAALEDLLGGQASPPAPFPSFPASSKVSASRTISTVPTEKPDIVSAAPLCLNNFRCFPIQVLLTLGLLSLLAGIGYVEWEWHTRSQAKAAGGLAAAGAVLGAVIGGATQQSYSAIMLGGITGVGLGYGGYYGALWATEVGKIAWSAVSFPSKPATPLIPSSPSHSPSVSSDP